MISKPENKHCMTTTTTDGGSICVKVMRQLRCRWWWHWWKEPEGTITSPRARWANHPPAPEITGSVALKCIVLNCVAVWPVFDALAAPWAGAWQLQRVTGNECSREVSGRELVLGRPHSRCYWGQLRGTLSDRGRPAAHASKSWGQESFFTDFHPPSSF